MYVANGMARGATQELGGRKCGKVYGKARPEEVAPEMRAALTKASAGLEVELFVKDLDREVRADASEALGSEEGAEARAWLHRFRSIRHLVAPAIRNNFWSLMARRVRSLKLVGL